jgi:hypothetical protein
MVIQKWVYSLIYLKMHREIRRSVMPLIEQSQTFEELIQLLELTIAKPKQRVVKLEQLVEPTEQELDSTLK